jgi:hypothetical protein
MEAIRGRKTLQEIVADLLVRPIEVRLRWKLAVDATPERPRGDGGGGPAQLVYHGDRPSLLPLPHPLLSPASQTHYPVHESGSS